jgi:hypothetical protein
VVPLFSLSLLVLVLVLVLVPTAMAADAPETTPETTIDIIAAAVRERGFACAAPRSVEHDAEASRPDRDAWLIACERGRFRVVYEGDTGPRVTPLD